MLSVKDHIKKTLDLSYPVIIGQLGFIMMGVVDSMMVGGIGAAPLAAASIANSLFILILVVGIGISFAVTPLVAISVGADKKSECGIFFRQSFIVNIIFSFLLIAVTVIASDFIGKLNQPKEVAVLAAPYAKLLGLSILPAMLFQTYKQFIEGLSIMRPAMIITLLANIINALVNWLLIYGNWGFPRLGLNGAGYATLFSRIFMALVLMFYVMNSKFFKEYDVSFNFKGFNWPVIKKILNLGLPSGVQYLFEVGAFSFAVVMVGWLGTKQLAAHQIAINLASISFMGVLGVSAAGSIRVGNAVGHKNVKEVRRAGFSAVLLGASMMSVSAVIFIFFRNSLPQLYIHDPVVISFASSILLIAALFQISDGVQAVGIGICRGLTDVKGPTIITFVAYWILGLPIGYFFGFILKMQVFGVWIGLLVGLTASAIMLTLRFNKKSKHNIEI